MFLREKWISQDSSTTPHPNPLSVSPPPLLRAQTLTHRHEIEKKRSWLLWIKQQDLKLCWHILHIPKWILRKKDLVVWWLEEAYFINRNLQCVASHFNTYSLKLSFCDSDFTYSLSYYKLQLLLYLFSSMQPNSWHKFMKHYYIFIWIVINYIFNLVR